MFRNALFYPFLLTLLLFISCQTPSDIPSPTTQSRQTPVEETSIPPTILVEPTVEPTATAPVKNTVVPDPLPSPAAFSGEWPAPKPPLPNLSREQITGAQRETAVQLEQNLPLDRDDILLAMNYLGVNFTFEPPPLITTPLVTGTQQQIFVNNDATNETSRPLFELNYVSQHGYFWFETTSPEYDSSTLITMGNAFDEIYRQLIFYFGPEDNPGIDGDPIIHIVNASPQTLCGSTSCGILGYVASINFLPNEVVPISNEREMFVMNASVFGTTTYLEVLAHEFRHMIEDRYDANDIDWEVEGSAMLAEDLLGFSTDPINRGNLFLANPDQQLNRWTDSNPVPYYGQGYVINRYIYNRLGQELYREFATSPLPGFQAIDEVAAQNGLELTGLSLWQDWLAALAIHTEPNAAQKYALRDGLQTAAAELISTFPYNQITTVNQYAADYYQLVGSDSVTINFSGSNHVPLLNTLPASGEKMWVANRGNNSQARITRTFDLTAVTAATLEYDVYHDIEYSYDFAYLSLSTDGGQTWQGLTAENMQGTQTADDPSDVSYTDRFYTGRESGWLNEAVDLSPYTGQEVQIRFEYVTDPILTFGGLAIDNIAIPEIGFYDDAETNQGWTAEGFVNATRYIPQQWHLQLIRFEKDAPIVASLTLSEDNSLSIDVPLSQNGGGPPILIIAASAPMTLNPAYYQLEVLPTP